MEVRIWIGEFFLEPKTYDNKDELGERPNDFRLGRDMNLEQEKARQLKDFLESSQVPVLLKAGLPKWSQPVEASQILGMILGEILRKWNSAT